MHEMSIAQSILEIVDDYMKKEKGRKLTQVAVEIGELAAVVPESLTFCYDALVENTTYQGSQLVITVLPLLAECLKCNQTTKIENYQFYCSVCQSTEIKISGGNALRISHLEVE